MSGRKDAICLTSVTQRVWSVVIRITFEEEIASLNCPTTFFVTFNIPLQLFHHLSASASDNLKETRSVSHYHTNKSNRVRTIDAFSLVLSLIIDYQTVLLLL